MRIFSAWPFICEWIPLPNNPIPSVFLLMADDRTPQGELRALSRRCWQTAAARFEASRRMRRCSNASTLCVAMLSVEIIIINLLVFIPSLSLDGNLVTIVTVCLSAFVLVLSLIISQLKYPQREEDYHRCGLRLAELEKKINIFEACNQQITMEKLECFNSEYQAILKESNLNHSLIDWEQALRHVNEKPYENKKKGADENKEDQGNSPKRSKCKENREKIWLYIRWHLLRSDSTYNLLTLIGAAIIVLVIMYGKTSSPLPANAIVIEKAVIFNHI